MTKGVVIKKNQVVIDGQKEPPPKRKVLSGKRLQVELKIPREKIEQELAVLKSEMMQNIEQLKASMASEKIDFENKQKVFEQTKNSMLTDIEKQKVEAREKGHAIGYEEGKKKGFDQGYQEGKQKGQEEFNVIKEEYTKNSKELFVKMEELNSYKTKIFEAAEPQLLTLIEEIVLRVVSKEMERNPELIVTVIKDALKRVNEHHRVKITVNPKHYDFLQENKERLLKEIGGINSLDIIQNDSIYEGGCMIETDYGLINATIKNKMLSIIEILNKAYEKEQEEIKGGGAISQQPVENAEEKTKSDDEDMFEENSEPISLDETDIDEEDLSFLNDDDDDSDDDDFDDFDDDDMEDLLSDDDDDELED